MLIHKLLQICIILFLLLISNVSFATKPDNLNDLNQQIDDISKSITNTLEDYIDSTTRDTILEKLNNLSSQNQADLKNIFFSLSKQSRDKVIALIETACKANDNITHQKLCFKFNHELTKLKEKYLP